MLIINQGRWIFYHTLLFHQGGGLKWMDFLFYFTYITEDFFMYNKCCSYELSIHQTSWQKCLIVSKKIFLLHQISTLPIRTVVSKTTYYNEIKTLSINCFWYFCKYCARFSVVFKRFLYLLRGIVYFEFCWHRIAYAYLLQCTLDKKHLK